MHISSHASCGVIVVVEANGTLRLSRMEYTKRGHTSIRHIMETGKNGQTVMDTLREGVLREGANDRGNFSMKILSTDPVHIDFVPDERNKGGTQIKVAFPVFVPEEQLRNIEARDDDDLDELHGPITLVEASNLVRETEGKTVKFHYGATRGAIVWAASNRNVFDRYQRLVTTWNPPELTKEQQEAIMSYHGKW